ncbi:MAG TPA: hypothetical protein VFB29_16405 [Pseudolabrys sp.]|nr:hypothetical protein [Pseudolabrys sp.]
MGLERFNGGHDLVAQRPSIERKAWGSSQNSRSVSLAPAFYPSLTDCLSHTGHEIGEPFAAMGSIAVIADMVLFGGSVLRRRHTGAVQSAPRPTLASAE